MYEKRLSIHCTYNMYLTMLMINGMPFKWSQIQYVHCFLAFKNLKILWIILLE